LGRLIIVDRCDRGAQAKRKHFSNLGHQNIPVAGVMEPTGASPAMVQRVQELLAQMTQVRQQGAYAQKQGAHAVVPEAFQFVWHEAFSKCVGALVQGESSDWEGVETALMGAGFLSAASREYLHKVRDPLQPFRRVRVCMVVLRVCCSAK
jgi:hypothetical protein